MKKTLRTIGAFALCAVLVPALGSCGGDDDDEPGGGGVIELDGTRLTFYNNLTLNYDSEGRFKSVSSPFISNAKLLEIDYSKGSIMLGDGEEEMEDMDVKFNGRGCISRLESSWDYTDNDEGDSYHYVGSGEMTFSYSGDGNLVSVNCKMSETEKDLDDGSVERYEEHYTIDYDWRDGNLVRAVKEGRASDPGYDDEEWNIPYTLSYGNQANKFLQTPGTIAYITFDDSLMQILAAVGLFGNGPVMLPAKFTETDEDDVESYNIVFTLNSNGTIAEERNGIHSYTYGYSAITRAAAGSATMPSCKVRDIFRSRAPRK